MADVLFTFDVAPDAVRRALTISEGIARFWTDVAFRNGEFSDETEEGRVAPVWGQVMVQLKRYVETGVAGPVFVHS